MSKIKNLFSALLFFLISSCSDHTNENTWVVGTSADNPPYEFMQDGEIVGFDIDFITEVAKYLGKPIEIKNMELHSLLAALSSNNIDLIIAGLSITPERILKVDFSIPYTSAKIAFLYRSEDKFTSHESLKDKQVGAQLGTIWNVIAHDLSEKNNFDIHSLSNNLMLVEDLKSKRIDAIVMEEVQADKFIELNPSFSKFLAEDLDSSFAIAMPKNSSNKKDIDAAIKALSDNGTIQTLGKKWGLISSAP